MQTVVRGARAGHALRVVRSLALLSAASTAVELGCAANAPTPIRSESSVEGAATPPSSGSSASAGPTSACPAQMPTEANAVCSTTELRGAICDYGPTTCRCVNVPDGASRWRCATMIQGPLAPPEYAA